MFILKNNIKKATLAYTALELLVAIAIIAMLAGLLLPAISSSQRKANEAKAKAMIESLCTTLAVYRNTFGSYPPDNAIRVGGATSTQSLYYHTATNFVAGVNSTDTITAGPLMEFRDKSLGSPEHASNFDMDGDGAANDPVYSILDPWGNPYTYELPGTNNTNSFDLSSDGADGTSSGRLNNWD